MSAAATLRPGLAHSEPIGLLPVVYLDAFGTAHHPDGKRTRCKRVSLDGLTKGTLQHHDRICKGCERRAGR